MKSNQAKTSLIPSAMRFLWTIVLVLSLSPDVSSQAFDPQLQDFVEQLTNAKSQAERDSLLAARKELLSVRLRRILIERGNHLLLAGKYSTAFDVYSCAEVIAGQIDDKEGLASATLNIGTVYYFQGNFDQALKYYQRARPLFVAIANQSEAAKALSGVALILKEQHKDSEALQAYEQALKEFEALDDQDEVSNTLGSIGSIYYARGDFAAASKAFLRSTKANDNSENVIHIADAFYMQGDYKQASDYYEKSLKGFERAGNEAGMVGALSGAANTSYYLGKYDEALAYYKRNAILQEGIGDKSGVATSLQGIGNVHRARGDLSSALESYLNSLAVAEGANIKTATAATLGSIGLVLAMQGDNVRARDYYGKSLALFEASGDKVGMSRMLAQLGNVYYAEGSYDPALESYQKSLALRVAMADKAGQANLQLGMGTVYLAQKNFASALESYQSALTMFESLDNKEAAANALARIANAYLLQGDYAQALDLAERANASAKQLESLSTVWYSRMIAGKAQRALKQPDEAGRSLVESIATVDSLRSQAAYGEAEAGRNSLQPRLAAVDLMIEQKRSNEAFDYAERAKAQALADLIGKSTMKITKGMSASEQAEERRLISDLLSLDLQLDRESQSRAPDQARRASLKDRLRQTRAAYQKFRQTLYAARPQLRVDRGELSPLKPDEAQALMNDGRGGVQTALLEFVITEANVYLFVLTGEPGSQTGNPRKSKARANESTVLLKAYQLNIGSQDLTQRVTHLQQLIANRDETLAGPARELYDLLLKPAEEQLANKTKLIIVPDGILWRLPFAALQPAADRYLIESASISYAPSLAALREMRKPIPLSTPTRSRTPSTAALAPAIAAFGNPLLTKELAQRTGRVYNGEKSAASVEQEKEVQKLGTVYGEAQSRIFAGAAASEERARAEAGHAGVIHFAAGAIMDDAAPMYSFVALSPGGGDAVTSPLYDGLLQSYEIMNLHSQARLVVYSDSTMKAERPGAGDAAIVLAWSWFVAGTPSAMISRWEVQSPALTLLMTEFHGKSKMRRPLKRPVSKAEALQQSALTLRRSLEYQHPYYWSGFALLGDGR